MRGLLKLRFNRHFMSWIALSSMLAAGVFSGAAGTPDARKPGLADQSIPERYRGKNVINKPKGFNEKVIALTFDDGPHPQNTPQVLNQFDRVDGKTTFFVVGTMAKANRRLLNDMAMRGHVIGSHSWSHKAAPTDKEAGPEIWKTARAIYDATGQWPSVYRPPYGIIDNRTSKVARQDRYGVILWNKSGADASSKATAKSIAQQVIGTAKPGDIVLLHDGPGKANTTIKALPTILDGLKKQGYSFITVPDMLRRWDAHVVRQAKTKKQPPSPKPTSK